jgi:hypothetical protein
LYLASGGRATLITESFFTREDWTAINPDTMLGVTVDNKYLSFYAQGSDPAGFVFDPVSGEIAFTDLDLYATAFFASPSDDKLYLAQESPDGSTNIVCWEGDSLRMFFDWKSKLFSLDTPEELSAYRVLADFSQGAVGQVDTSLADPRWGALDSVELNSCPLGGAVINETQYRDNAPTLLFKLYLDGLLAFQDYITDSSPARLPEASKAETAQVELIGNIPVRKVVVARSIEEAMS